MTHHYGLIVDNFAGGGGASTGIEQAMGRPVDIAINHDPEAIAMHSENHPWTKHYCEDVWDVDPVEATDGKPVLLAWFSPDCKHFSKAKGGKPVSKKVRGLAWLVIKWAKLKRPKVIFLENVEEFQTWGPIADDGKPCPERKGQTFATWKKELEKLGYVVEHRELVACDYGAPTIRKRLFIIARCDGESITWPEATHGPGLKPYRTAADIIDWSLPCPSIFERKRPLAENTLRRIARGIQKFVVECPDPYIAPVNAASFITECANASHQRNMPIDSPLRTICAQVKGGHFALVSPLLASTMVQTGYGERPGQKPRVPGLHKPLGTIVAGGTKHALVSAFLAKHYTGVTGQKMDQPIGTITSVDHHSLVTSNLVKLRGSCQHGQRVDKPVPTITAGGNHLGEVRAFLLKYYGTNIGHGARQPLQTITSKHRFGLVTVKGVDYQIVDIGLRMLQPRELYAAQGFPSDYVINMDFNGKPLTKTAQVRMVGNSVCPDAAEALVSSNMQKYLMEKAA